MAVKVLISVISLLISWQGHAQHHSELIENYSKEAYKGGTQNWDILQHSDGVIYVGNNKGILSYNGNEWDLQRLPNRTIVRCLQPRKEGGVYAGGQNEFGFYESRLLRSENYRSLRSIVPAEFHDFEDVWKIYEVGDTAFFCTERAVFVYCDTLCDVFEPADERFENFFLVDEVLLVQETDGSLNAFYQEGWAWELPESELLNDRIVSILASNGPEKLIVLRSGAILRWKPNGDLSEISSQATDFTRSHKAYCAIRLEDGRYLIGTTQNGAILVNDEWRIVAHWNKDMGLLNNTVLSAFQDVEGNVWLGLDNGLSYVEINSPFSRVDRFNGLEGTGYAALKYGNETYLGTNLGLYHASSATEEFKLMDRTKGQIWSMQDFGNYFALNTHDGAFFYRDGDFEPISNVKGSWKILDVAADENLMLQGAYGGFYLYQKTGDPDRPLELRGKLAGFEESARIFEEDEHGNIWASHAYLGLYRLSPDYEKLGFSKIERFDSRNGLPEDLYITVSKIRNELIFATTKGVYRFDEENSRFEPHPTFTDLLGEEVNVLRIFEDEQGNVWFVTEERFGMIQILPSGLFNEVDVLYFNEIQDDLVDGFEDVFSFSDTVVYIPLESGFYRFNPAETVLSDFSHDLAITEITLTKSDSLIYTGGPPLETELKPGQNNLSFHYALPAYGKLNRIQYQTQLVGFDEDWSDYGTALSRQYNNLEWGEYVFKVRARNSFGEESDVATYSFTILPPWYGTLWAQVLFTVAFFLVLGGVIRSVVIRESKKTEAVKEESEQTIRKKEQEFQKEKQRSESEIIRLRNEKLRSEVSHKNAELASTTMHLVQKSEILQKIKDDLDQVAKKAEDDLKAEIRRIGRVIDEDVRLDRNWERFETHFDQVHENFFKNLRMKYPDLTPKDQKLCAYLRMNLTTKEIAPLLNISVRGVEISRYRLRKKLNLDTDVNLVSFIMEI